MATVPAPPFALYVVWHPGCAGGKEVATLLYRHFGTERYRSLAGGAGIPVLYRCANAPNANAPLPIGWGEAATTAVVVLMDDCLVRDPSWARYFQDIVREAAPLGFGARVFPVAMDAGALGACGGIQALRWDKWEGNGDGRGRRLVRDLTERFIGMLRHRPERGRPGASEEPEYRTESVRIFLSHSTKDQHGKRIAESVRDWLHRHGTVSGFLASRDIPAGERFDSVITGAIRNSVVAIIYTDSYSSREWCRREVIEAKRANMPILLVDCLESVDERSFPYMGNVPVVRMDPASEDAIPAVAGRLLDEALRHYLWRRGVENFRKSAPQATFMARPPELLSLALLPDTGGNGERLVVYPDPPLGAAELGLFSDADHGLRLYSLKQWHGEAGQ